MSATGGIERSIQLQQQIRAKISDVYYDTRNSGGTMEDAAHRASTEVMLLLVDERILVLGAKPQ